MDRFNRQNFLGCDSEAKLSATTIGLVGLGGGGSHIVQQASHVGIGGFVVVDPDEITLTNTNRLVGGTLADVSKRVSKISIAERQIRGLVKRPRIVTIKDTWHVALDELKHCDVIVGCVDSFIERDQLERFARVHLIPYIDIGMDVHALPNREFLVAGQVILSMPGKPCLRCCGLITDERLRAEAQKYGAAGDRPQVVWPNGVLASTAVSILMQILTPWFQGPATFVYLDYDGNRNTVTPNERMKLYANRGCEHHPIDQVGAPLFDIREFRANPQ